MSSAISTPFGELPESWEYHEVKDHTEFLTGPAFDSNFFNTDGKGARLVRGINLTKGATRWDAEKTKFWDQDLDFFSKYLLKQNDVLIGMDGSLVGHNYAYLKKSDLPALLVQRVARLRTNENVNSKFLYYLFGTEAWLSYVEIVKTNSGIPHISNGDIKSFVIPYPPLPEQQKIAAILSSVDDVIEKTRAQIDKLKDLKTGMMQELLTKGIGSGGVPHTEFKDSPLGQMPKSWKLVDLGSIAKFSQGIQVGIELHYEVNTENRVRFLRISDFTKDDEKPRYIDSKLATKGVVKKDDIVMVRYGEAGRVCRGLSGAIANNLFKIKPEEQLDKDFLHLYLSMPTISQMISMMAASSAMPAINFSSLSKLKIVLPDINEQREIALAIKKIELKLSVTKNKLAGYELLKKALMQDLLTGKVRVKVDQKESAVA
ncbi:restriction endonuclease subunit S [Marinobacter sp.]|uniref:restriction endonuclease subunit S n=1 Tax=Marinobacter sp. TaxID=50741 RepID=UPI003A9065A9